MATLKFLPSLKELKSFKAYILTNWRTYLCTYIQVKKYLRTFHYICENYYFTGVNILLLKCRLYNINLLSNCHCLSLSWHSMAKFDSVAFQKFMSKSLNKKQPSSGTLFFHNKSIWQLLLVTIIFTTVPFFKWNVFSRLLSEKSTIQTTAVIGSYLCIRICVQLSTSFR